MRSIDEIFGAVRSHLLSQAAISEDDGGSCRLRGRDGRRCAIGVLIDDRYYSERLEGLGIGYYKAGQDGPLLQALALSGVDAYEPRVAAMLQDLEDLHDAADVPAWPAQLDVLARRHGIVAWESFPHAEVECV
ncbi:MULTISPECIES: hypothetical protein [unclassified Caballeronia]|uniref:hypothetical protein n=1 Tax=unclassified Caballeronia TaxID=2646786 RepID=UPI0028590450|nr:MULTISPECIES: hypothetical protein [unclassified Caballeronia]MDR5741052.1 hypothetical protein [Caballeronia sp. LZ016]MDR5806950.1 hypothetical protein [Caballeronia sp. LZ019]